MGTKILRNFYPYCSPLEMFNNQCSMLFTTYLHLMENKSILTISTRLFIHLKVWSSEVTMSYYSPSKTFYTG